MTNNDEKIGTLAPGNLMQEKPGEVITGVHAW